jgi:DNA-binding NtrC family response regulator
LFYRLNVVTLRIPSLKDRKEDIPQLVEYFLTRKLKSKAEKHVSREALEMLEKHDWPGNVRELEHVIEGAVILSHDNIITPADLSASISSADPIAAAVPLVNAHEKVLTISELEKLHIEHALVKFNYNRGKTAEALGITPKTLYLKIKKFRINLPTEV